MRKLAQKGAHCAIVHSAAAKVRGNQRGEYLVLLQHLVVFGDKNIVSDRARLRPLQNAVR